MPTSDHQGTIPSRASIKTAAVNWGLAYAVTLLTCLVLA